ncbi:MAG: hypothetical protein NTY19_33135 [Planctomycetota bacterium]|nr:hypothetical protein [Planctomycetota bacterium]
MTTKRILLGCLLLGISVLPTLGVRAQDQSPPRSVDQLAVQQGVVADKYGKLEKLLEDMARIEAVSNPKRAALLMQVLKQSKENLTAAKLNSIVKLLSQEQLKRALENQQDVRKDLQGLLELLLSENRSDRLKSEQERIREYLKEVERILRLEKSVQGRTEGGVPTEEVAKDQAKVAERTGQLGKKIQENEESDASGGKKQPGPEGSDKKPDRQEQEKQDDGKGQPKQKPEDKPSDEPKGKDQGQGSDKGQGKEGQSKDGQEKGPSAKEQGKDRQGQGKPAKEPGKGGGQGQKSKDGQSQDQGQQEPGQQGPSDDSDQPPQAKQDQAGNPARKRVQAAEQKMRDAQKKLEEAQRKEAVQEQEQAKEELEKAKAELERILRQLREEEVERVLALLEGRFRKMLEIQMRIYEDTTRLDKVPELERELKVNVPAGKLASEERKLVVEADKALNLLMEEGSSVAFPETVGQMRDDMQQATDRLDAANVGKITQGIEQDIIAALEELIAALQKAQKDRDKKQQQSQPMPPGQPQDQPLVDSLAELKMIRSLQMRVNTRTQRYAKLLDNIEDPTGQATDQELRDALLKLAEKQDRIYRVTRDLVLGKNK